MANPSRARGPEHEAIRGGRTTPADEVEFKSIPLKIIEKSLYDSDFGLVWSPRTGSSESYVHLTLTSTLMIHTETI